MKRIYLIGVVLLALAGPGSAQPPGDSWQEQIRRASSQDIDNSTIYRGLELQGVQLAYQIHEAQLAYRAEHGNWAEYRIQLEEGGYLHIPAFMPKDASFMLVAMHDLKASGLPVVSYEAEICVRDPQSGWQYGCLLENSGRIVDIADTHSFTELGISASDSQQQLPLQMGSVWPQPLLCSTLPMTERLKQEILALGQKD